MGRIIAIDYGRKRTGLAVTDPLRIIANGLTTVETPALMKFLKEYCSREAVDVFLVGDPRNLDGSDTHVTADVEKLVLRLKKEFPDREVITADERFTSKRASRAMIDMGMKKMQRRKKELVDEIAATILLQEYLG